MAGDADAADQPTGVSIRNAKTSIDWLQTLLAPLDLATLADIRDEAGTVHVALKPDAARQLTPDHDTLQLARDLPDDGDEDARLEREIAVAMLASPQGFAYPNDAEFVAAVRARRHIAHAARRSALNFDPHGIERPDGWTYHEDTGFTIVPGELLIDALQKATQPELTGRSYAFSCYRATEYVILLGIAETLREFNPGLLQGLQRQWETRAVMSGRFHDTFLHEYGSMAAPLPARYYVPGDRLWFRNPDAASSDVQGYEGSWVIYMGDGLFSNFWKREQPYTLSAKCIEIYHWRHGLRHDGDGGAARIDETVVETRLQESLADPAASSAILERMLRYRDPQGVYADGGCIDSTRECPRRLCTASTDIELPVSF